MSETIDLDGLLRVNLDLDLDRVRALLSLVVARGYHRGEDLGAKLDRVLARFVPA